MKVKQRPPSGGFERRSAAAAPDSVSPTESDRTAIVGSRRERGTLGKGSEKGGHARARVR